MVWGGGDIKTYFIELRAIQDQQAVAIHCVLPRKNEKTKESMFFVLLLTVLVAEFVTRANWGLLL